MSYNKRKFAIPAWVNKPTSPSARHEPWVTIIIRKAHYKMLREMATYHDLTIGKAAMKCIEQEFNALLKTVDPEAAEFIVTPVPRRKFGRPVGTKDSKPRRKPKLTIEELLKPIPRNAPHTEKGARPTGIVEDEIDLPRGDPKPDETTAEDTAPEDTTPARRKLHVSRF